MPLIGTKPRMDLLKYMVDDGSPITEAELARKLGVHPSTVNHSYNGLAKHFSLADYFIVKKKVFNNTIYQAGHLLNPPKNSSEEFLKASKEIKEGIREIIYMSEKLNLELEKIRSQK